MTYSKQAVIIREKILCEYPDSEVAIYPSEGEGYPELISVLTSEHNVEQVLDFITFIKVPLEIDVEVFTWLRSLSQKLRW